MFNLSGKIVLVIGVIGGIGELIVWIMYVVGVDVVLLGCCVEKFEVFVGEFGECIYIVVCDLFDLDQVDVLVGIVIEFGGKFDIFVVNVGVICDKLLMQMKDEDF